MQAHCAIRILCEFFRIFHSNHQKDKMNILMHFAAQKIHLTCDVFVIFDRIVLNSICSLYSWLNLKQIDKLVHIHFKIHERFVLENRAGYLFSKYLQRSKHLRKSPIDITRILITKTTIFFIDFWILLILWYWFYFVWIWSSKNGLKQ